MDLRPSGGIFWRLDSSGNLTGYDTVGTAIAKFTGGAFSSSLTRGVLTTNSPITSTLSTTAVSTGYGLLLTPKITSAALVLFSISASIATTGQTATFTIRRVNGSAVPAGGASATGDPVMAVLNLAAVGGEDIPLTIVNVVGATPNQAVVFYLAFATSNAASAASFNSADLSALVIEV